MSYATSKFSALFASTLAITLLFAQAAHADDVPACPGEQPEGVPGVIEKLYSNLKAINQEVHIAEIQKDKNIVPLVFVSDGTLNAFSAVALKLDEKGNATGFRLYAIEGGNKYTASDYKFNSPSDKDGFFTLSANKKISDKGGRVLGLSFRVDGNPNYFKTHASLEPGHRVAVTLEYMYDWEISVFPPGITGKRTADVYSLKSDRGENKPANWHLVSFKTHGQEVRSLLIQPKSNGIAKVDPDTKIN